MYPGRRRRVRRGMGVGGLGTGMLIGGLVGAAVASGSRNSSSHRPRPVQQVRVAQPLPGFVQWALVDGQPVQQMTCTRCRGPMLVAPMSRPQTTLACPSCKAHVLYLGPPAGPMPGQAQQQHAISSPQPFLPQQQPIPMQQQYVPAQQHQQLQRPMQQAQVQQAHPRVYPGQYQQQQPSQNYVPQPQQQQQYLPHQLEGSVSQPSHHSAPLQQQQSYQLEGSTSQQSYNSLPQQQQSYQPEGSTSQPQQSYQPEGSTSQQPQNAASQQGEGTPSQQPYHNPQSVSEHSTLGYGEPMGDAPPTYEEAVSSPPPPYNP